MVINSFFLAEVRRLNILEVAQKLELDGLKVHPCYGLACCFLHPDSNPSFYLRKETGRWKCLACGQHGNVIDLVMRHEQLAFKEACEWFVKEGFLKEPLASPQFNHSKLLNSYGMTLNHSTFLDSQLLIVYCGTSNEFTQAMVNNHILTREQMERARVRFHLSTAGENVIFWSMDENDNLCEGKVMPYQADGHRSKTRKPVTVSYFLKREHQLSESWRAPVCLFGLHQLNKEPFKPIAVVESEKTAIICSELLEDEGFLWMATGGFTYLSVECLKPLKGRKIILFPDTDEDGTTFRTWQQRADEAAKWLGHPVTVSDLLERFALPEEKKRKIDLADFLLARRDD